MIVPGVEAFPYRQGRPLQLRRSMSAADVPINRAQYIPGNAGIRLLNRENDSKQPETLSTIFRTRWCDQSL